MKTIFTIIAALIYLLNGVTLAQDFEEVYLAYDPDSALNDNFGFAVGISGNYAIVGAPYESEDAAGENTLLYAGSAFIFERDEYGNWNLVQKIVASDRIDSTAFGFSAGISGNYIILGAPFNDTDVSGENYKRDAGCAYIFKRDAYGNWEEMQKIVPSDRSPEDRFGYSVSISDSYAVIGAYYEDEDSLGLNTMSNAGSVYIFHRNESDSWEEMQKIVSSDRQESDHFGDAVSISYPYLIVGAPSENEDENGENTLESPGSAYIFELEENRWIEVQKITAAVRANYGYFGDAVSVSGNLALVGAKLESKDDNEADYKKWAGAAYIFERGSGGTWDLKKKIVASDRNEEDNFGISVSISGNNAIVGANYEAEDVSGNNTMEEAGSAYIFHRNEDRNWNETRKLVVSDRRIAGHVGGSVGISGDYAILGRGDERSFYWPGAANIYEACTHGTASDPDNIIENGSFEACMLSPWSLYHADYLGVTASAVLYDGKCTISCITLSASPVIYEVQLNQKLSSTQINKLEIDSTYILTFDAFAEKDNRQCRISFEQSDDPWANIMSKSIILGTVAKSYSFEFILSSLYTDMQLSFQAGLETSPVTFDNVRLVKKVGGSTTALNQTESDKVRLYPNPVSEYITVIAETGSEVKLYNSVGLLIREGVSVAGRLTFDVAGLPDGVYLIGINRNDSHSIHKVVIIR